MENEEKKSQAQHSTGKHPEPSENVQSDIETVTPDTENPGHEDVNTHENQNKGDTRPEHDQAVSDDTNREQGSEQQDSKEQETEEQGVEQQGSEEQDSEQQNSEEHNSDEQSNTDDSGDGDVRGEVETVSP